MRWRPRIVGKAFGFAGGENFHPDLVGGEKAPVPPNEGDHAAVRRQRRSGGGVGEIGELGVSRQTGADAIKGVGRRESDHQYSAATAAKIHFRLTREEMTGEEIGGVSGAGWAGIEPETGAMKR